MRIKGMRTKFDIKIEWNQMPRDEIEKKLIKKDSKQIAIIRMMTQFNTKTKWEDTLQF